jgi:hypothetical protein
MDQLHSISP